MSFFQRNRTGQTKQIGQRGRVHTAVLAGSSIPANAAPRNQGPQAVQAGRQAGRKPSVRRDLAEKQAAVNASVVAMPDHLRKPPEGVR